ncbi:MAG: hypothetical protein IRZ08_13620, partial [Frankia sp.]|nr:hypothetical protein [Frankia sp.]
ARPPLADADARPGDGGRLAGRMGELPPPGPGWQNQRRRGIRAAARRPDPGGAAGVGSPTVDQPQAPGRVGGRLAWLGRDHLPVPRGWPGPIMTGH